MADIDRLTVPEHDWQQALAQAAAHGDERPTWAYPWPAGERLLGALGELIDCRGKRICDLGCGRGRLGLQALLLGADRLCFADGSQEVLTFLQAVLAANGLDDRATCCRHRWGTPIPGGPYDCILGGDILYRPECFGELFASIAASLTVDGIALLSDPRTALEADLPGIAAACGLSWHSLRHEDRFTLISCRPSR